MPKTLEPMKKGYNSLLCLNFPFKQFSLLFLILLLNHSNIFAQAWEKIKDGANFQASIMDNAGNLYLLDSNGKITKWDGLNWSSIGIITKFKANSLAYNNQNKILYVGGSADGDNASAISKWSAKTKQWSDLPIQTVTEIDEGESFTYNIIDGILAMLFRKGNLYIAGDYGVSKWNGQSWARITEDIGAYHLAEKNNEIYAVLDNENASGYIISKWNSSTWSPINGNIDGEIKTMTFDQQGNLYISGFISKVGTSIVNYAAKWNGNRWSNAGNNIQFEDDMSDTGGKCGFQSMLSINNTLYASGAISTTANKFGTILKLNAGQWSIFEKNIPKSFTSDVDNQNISHSLAYDKTSNYLYAPTNSGVYRFYLGTVKAPSIKSGTWTSIGKTEGYDFFGEISSLFSINNQLYVGGRFKKIGGKAAYSIAKWDGIQWSALGNGLRGRGQYPYGLQGVSVNKINADANGNIYTAGSFTGLTTDIKDLQAASKENAYEIGKWDGTQWSALCKGCNGWTSSIAFDNTKNVYISSLRKGTKGICKNINTSPENISIDLVRYQSDYTLADMNTQRYIALDKNNTLYATGDFTKAGNNTINGYIAKWTGTSWQPLGAGLNKEGTALQIHKQKHKMYVAGKFSSAGGIKTFGVAQYNISTGRWAAMGKNYVFKDELILGKNGGIYAYIYHPKWAATYFSKWNGLAWSPLIKKDDYEILEVDKNGNIYAVNNYKENKNGEVFKWTPAGTTTPKAAPIPSNTVSTALPNGKEIISFQQDISLPLDQNIAKRLSNTKALTIEYWFKGTDLQSAVRIQNDKKFIIAGWGANNPVHLLSNEGFNNTLKINAPEKGINVEDGKWHHIAMTWEQGKINGFKSYVDGKLIEAKNAGNTALPNLTDVIPTLGAYEIDETYRSEFLKGELARVRIWKTARTAAAIRASMQSHTISPNQELLYPASIRPISGKVFNGVTDHVNIYDPSNLGQQIHSSNALTIEYWFKGNNLQSAFRYQLGNNFIVSGWNSANPVHLLSNEGFTNTLKINAPEKSINVEDGKWHHIAMTWQKGTAQGFKSYVDGILVDVKNASNTALPNIQIQNVKPALGAYVVRFNTTELLTGELARVRVWKVARTEAQIKESRSQVQDYPINVNNGLLYQNAFSN